jgi:hypothetical protein
VGTLLAILSNFSQTRNEDLKIWEIIISTFFKPVSKPNKYAQRLTVRNTGLCDQSASLARCLKLTVVDPELWSY